jgi:hypothetical protein
MNQSTCFLRDAEIAGKLVAADAVFATGEKPECGEPLVEPDR